MDDLYLSLLRQGYKHYHIDNEMDIWHYLRLISKSTSEDSKQESQENYTPMENII